MAQTIFAVVVLVFTLAIVFGDDDPSQQMKPKGSCGPAVFQKISACCEPPRTLKDDAFDACMPKRGPMNSTGSKPPKPSPYHIMCLFECVLKGQNMLSDVGAGRINFSVLTPSFIRAVNSTWAARTRSSITTCASVASRFQVTSIPKPTNGEKYCNPKPAVFMNCFKQNMLQACAATQGTKCDATALEKLRNATPLDLLMKADSA